MGQKEDTLKNLLKEEFDEGKHSKPSPKELLESPFVQYIYAVYSQLNGQLGEPPTRFQGWDVQLKDFIVELDEEQHFNRYRLKTLNSDFYNQVNVPFDLERYKHFCKDFEEECLKKANYRGYWWKEKSDEQFGKSSEEGNLKGNGSSRWKQRAFYDFLRDISSKIMDIPVVRLSIYEDINGKSLDHIIQNQKKDLLIEAINKRL